MTPTHAYIPGQTPRHPDGAFDVLRDSVRVGMTEVELATSAAMQAGLRFLDQGYYWEAHEVLEPVWMACPPNSEARSMAQALIQLANARLKLAMGQPRAAGRIVALAAAHLDEVRGEAALGVAVKAVRESLETVKSAL